MINNISIKKDYYILSCSFGKDSLYLLHYIIDNFLPLDEVQFVEPYFDDNISALLPEHKLFITRVIDYFATNFGIKFNIIRSDFTYSELYLKYGVPSMRGCHWCTGWLKTIPLNAYNTKLKENYNIFVYLGYCFDELERAKKNNKKNYIYPLVDGGITESYCYDWCEKNNLLSPIYSNKIKRDGCWFCPFQRKLSWQLLKLNYPYLFDAMVKLEKERSLNFDCYNYVFKKPLDIVIKGEVQLDIFDYGGDKL